MHEYLGHLAFMASLCAMTLLAQAGAVHIGHLASHHTMCSAVLTKLDLDIERHACHPSYVGVVIWSHT